MASTTSGTWDWRSINRKLGIPEKIFVAALIIWVLLYILAPTSAARSLLNLALLILGFWVLLRVGRQGIRQAIWSLRNRLYVAYVFIALVPICLILILTILGAYMFTGQVAVYLVTAELERRTNDLRSAAELLLVENPARQPERVRDIANRYAQRLPNLEILLRNKRELRFPEDASITTPPEGWGTVSGLVYKDDKVYAWAHAISGTQQVVMAAPLTTSLLSSLVPHLGEISYMAIRDDQDQQEAKKTAKRSPRIVVDGNEIRPAVTDTQERVPPSSNQFDVEVDWFAVVPIAIWDSPPQVTRVALYARTRASAVLRTLTSQQTDVASNFAPIFFLFFSILFLLMELAALVVGITLTRTITSAVEGLYQGTQKIRKGDFTHRIEVKGQDQLAELSVSFNRMTEDLERLLAVAKEKERLQAELELAREVQGQLYPKCVPAMKTLSLLAACNPARLVSGDYFDYQKLMDNKLAIAVGDVAGKGISAALLMATVSSSLRTQLRSCMEEAALIDRAQTTLATSQLVSHLNKQIYIDTAPEKYLTFYFGIYDDTSSVLTYTNAGHLPPLVIRDGAPVRLDVNGTVVGAFPFSRYGESTIQLLSGDLLVCYTDGITEPENEYGEMFGEERLIRVLVKNAEHDDQRLMNTVMDAVREWTGTEELQDDMTMLLARRL